MTTLDDLEKELRALLKGQFTSLHLTFNDPSAIDYMSVKQWVEEGPEDAKEGWVSEAEMQRAMETNAMWRLQWYPETPVVSHELQASSLDALVSGLRHRLQCGERGR
jgi:hypothetical protein